MSRKSDSSGSAKVRPYRTKRNRITPILATLFVAAVGSYLVFISSAYTPGPWGGGSSGTATVTPAANPKISQTCTGALNIALVADVSGSIQSDDMNSMQTAFKQIIGDLLPGTKAEFSLTQFSGQGQVMNQFTNKIGALDNSIDNFRNGVGSGGTAWADGLTQAYGTFGRLNSTAPKLLIIATDGDPNVPGGNALDPAITEANAIKAAGIHILAIGLNGQGGSPNQANLELLTGTNVSNGTNMTINTDVVISNFSNLGNTLLKVITGGCPSGTGLGNGGTGVGTNGNGKGTGGTGAGSGGTGTGTQGAGKGSSGSGSGDTAGPSPSSNPTPTPTPSSQPTTQTTPTPTPTPTPTQAPSSSPTQISQAQQPAPAPTAQGTQTQPPQITPSPFYDGKQYSPGSVADKFAAATVPHTSHSALVIVIILVIILGGGGGSYWYFVWRKQHTGPGMSKTNPAAKQPVKR